MGDGAQVQLQVGGILVQLTVAGSQLRVQASRVVAGGEAVVPAVTATLTVPEQAAEPEGETPPAGGHGDRERQAPARLSTEQRADLERQIQDHGEWTATRRIERAFQAGRNALEKLEGRSQQVEPVAVLPMENRVYAILRTATGEAPVHTRTWRQARAFVGSPPLQASVFHAFPSAAEATAYCLGAGLEGLPPQA